MIRLVHYSLPVIKRKHSVSKSTDQLSIAQGGKKNAKEVTQTHQQSLESPAVSPLCVDSGTPALWDSFCFRFLAKSCSQIPCNQLHVYHFCLSVLVLLCFANILPSYDSGGTHALQKK